MSLIRTQKPLVYWTFILSQCFTYFYSKNLLSYLCIPFLTNPIFGVICHRWTWPFLAYSLAEIFKLMSKWDFIMTYNFYLIILALCGRLGKFPSPKIFKNWIHVFLLLLLLLNWIEVNLVNDLSRSSSGLAGTDLHLGHPAGPMDCAPRADGY